MNDDGDANILEPDNGVVKWETKGKSVEIHSPSPAFIQHFYAEITGQSENRSKNFKGNKLISFGSLEQLHSKIEQTVAPLSVKARSSKIIVKHLGGETQTFSSFDRFKLYNRSNTCAIVALRYEYSCMVAAPDEEGTSSLKEKFKKYEISLAMNPFIKAKNGAENEMVWIERNHIIGVASIHANINYVDFMVSESLLSTISSWVDSLSNLKSRPIVTALKKRSHILPDVFSDAAKVCFASLFAWTLFSTSIVIDSPLKLAQVTSVFIGAYIISSALLRWGHVWFTESIPALDDYILLDINEGDKRNIDAVEQIHNKGFAFVLLTLGSLVSTFGLAILANWVSAQIFGASQ